MQLLSLRKANKSPLTKLEWLVIGVVAVACLRLAIPNFFELRTRAADASAYAVYEEVKDFLMTSASNSQSLPTALVFNQSGPGSLPSPFSKITLSNNVKISYIVSLHYPGFFDLTSFEVTHLYGDKRYRLVSVNNRITEQVLEK